jgi:hypothetical protein
MRVETSTHLRVDALGIGHASAVVCLAFVDVVAYLAPRLSELEPDSLDSRASRVAGGARVASVAGHGVRASHAWVARSAKVALVRRPERIRRKQNLT